MSDASSSVQSQFTKANFQKAAAKGMVYAAADNIMHKKSFSLNSFGMRVISFGALSFIVDDVVYPALPSLMG